MSGVEKLANAAHLSRGQEANEFTGAVVTGVNPDGTIDLRYLGEDHTEIESLASYTNRQVGDQVMVRDSGSRWTVLGKIGAEVTGTPNISWGNGNPVGADWETSASVKVRPGQIYIQGAAFAAENSVPTSQAIINASDDRAFRGVSPATWNHAFSGRPAQGIDNTGFFGTDPWRGGWYYGTALQTAVAAKTVRSMELRIERSAEPNFGLDEPVIPKIYVHNDTGTGTTLGLDEGPWQATPLAIGQSAWWSVPQVVIDMFVANTIKGFAIHALTQEEFMVMAEYAGDVRITN